MLKRLHISNYKSIYDETIELGRFNVFIGENGSGKTNILEALGMASAASENKLSNDELALKGIRVAKPTITFSSFLGEKQKEEILIEYENVTTHTNIKVKNFISSNEPDNIFSKWLLNVELSDFSRGEEQIFNKTLFSKERLNKLFAIYDSNKMSKDAMEFNFNNFSLIQYLSIYEENLKNFQIYNLSTQILRGIGGHSLAIPGIQGENLDRLIESFDKDEFAKLLEYAYFINWLEKIEIDNENRHKSNGHKLGNSTSLLYFRDKYMQRKNNLFSAENANEGVLHILFYLALFISKHTPKLFGIDNIETALNPELCKKLIEQLVKLSKTEDKQVLITTHNPAALDGLDLHDDEQRLFKVYRNRKGHTKVKRITLKPDQKLNGEGFKLSELWMRNYIGAIPQNL